VKQLARLSALAILAVVLCLFMSACALFKSPDAAFVAGVDAGLSPGEANGDLLNKYDKYVDADTTLTEDTRKIEHKTAAMLRKLLADAKAK
jgi:hypothetical protein